MNDSLLPELVDIALWLLLPTFVVALATTAIGRWLSGPRWLPLLAALALILGVVVGNHFRKPIPWFLEADEPVSLRDYGQALRIAFEGRDVPQEGSDSVPSHLLPPRRYWLPALTLLAMLVELGCTWPRCPAAVAWTLRTATCLFAGRLLVPLDLQQSAPWLPWAFAGNALLLWGTLTTVQQRHLDTLAPVCLAFACAAAAVVIVHAHSSRLADTAFLFAAAMGGISVVVAAAAGNVAPVLAAGALFLPGLLVNGYHETFSDVPWTSYLLAALAPLGMSLLLLPKIESLSASWRWSLGLALPGLLALTAIVLAARAERVLF